MIDPSWLTFILGASFSFLASAMIYTFCTLREGKVQYLTVFFLSVCLHLANNIINIISVANGTITSANDVIYLLATITSDLFVLIEVIKVLRIAFAISVFMEKMVKGCFLAAFAFIYWKQYFIASTVYFYIGNGLRAIVGLAMFFGLVCSLRELHLLSREPNKSKTTKTQICRLRALFFISVVTIFEAIASLQITFTNGILVVSRTVIVMLCVRVILCEDEINRASVSPFSSVPFLTYKVLLEKAGYVLYLKDLSGRYIEVNEIGHYCNGMKRSEIVGKTDSDLLDEETASLILSDDSKALAMGVPVSTDIQFKKTKEHWLTTRVVLRDDSGHIAGLMGISKNVTEGREAAEHSHDQEKKKLQAQADAALLATKVKSDFLANMSHEIRTPINGVMGLNNLLKDTTNLDAVQLEYVSGINQSCVALMSIVNDILDIAKVEAGMIRLDEMDFLVSETLKDIMFVHEKVANSKHVSVNIENKLPQECDRIHGDYGRLRQILTNLIGNSVKFTPEHGLIFVTVTLVERELNDQEKTRKNFIKFDISDTGIGIPKDRIGSLFRPFIQAESSTTRNYGGTGLGLSISKSLVELMGGSITVISEVGKGSTFSFEIPFIAGKPESAKELDNSSSSEDGFGKKLNILLVEDNVINQKVAKRTLEHMGHKVTVAANGAEAVKSLSEPHEFSLVLMDCFMPILDGYEATKEIRKLEEPTRSIPIIAMTANAVKGEREHCLNVGMDDFVSKPFDKAELERLLLKYS